jgi:Lrp/AsnC family transcriptional regulator, leucine-responsive regulatory protein
MIKEKLGIDEKDVKILSFYIENPEISQNEIAEKLKLSQPSVFVRIQKLKKKGLLDFKVGIDISKTKLFLTRVDLTSKNPSALLEEMKNCPFFVNGFIMSGMHNVSMMLVHEDLKKVDEIVNTHLRPLNTVSNIEVNVVVSSAKDCTMQLDLSHEISNEKCSENGKCSGCKKVDVKFLKD